MSYTNEGGSLIITGESSTGKSKLMEVVLNCFPREKTKIYTYTSERFLLYSKEPIAHKILAFYELKGSEVAQYSIRTGLSETKLRLGTVDKSGKGQLKAKEIEKDTTGMVFMATTVEDRINPELETRVFKIELKPQTPQELEQIFTLQQDDSYKEKWQKALSLLEPREVIIPFLQALAKAFPKDKERYKRDFRKVVGLIKASTILNQFQREQTPDGKLIASEQDYRTVYFLADLITDSLCPVRETTRQFLEAIAQYEAQYGQPPSKEEIAKVMNKSEASIRKYAQEAKAKGLIEVLIEKRKVYYHLLELPQVKPVLPEPEEIFNSPIISLSTSDKTNPEAEENLIKGKLSGFINLSPSQVDTDKVDKVIKGDKNGIIRFSTSPEATLGEVDKVITGDNNTLPPENGDNKRTGELLTSFKQFLNLLPPEERNRDPQMLYYFFEEFRGLPIEVIKEGLKRNTGYKGCLELTLAYSKWYVKEFLQ